MSKPGVFGAVAAWRRRQSFFSSLPPTHPPKCDVISRCWQVDHRALTLGKLNALKRWTQSGRGGRDLLCPSSYPLPLLYFRINKKAPHTLEELTRFIIQFSKFVRGTVVYHFNAFQNGNYFMLWIDYITNLKVSYKVRTLMHQSE